jgi:hypothetical protein
LFGRVTHSGIMSQKLWRRQAYRSAVGFREAPVLWIWVKLDFSVIIARDYSDEEKILMGQVGYLDELAGL